MKRPSIHQLEVFCRVVQLCSMARAAEELHVAPSSISMQIQELERRYRTRLLVRGARRTVPTTAGSALYTAVLGLLQGLDAVERQLSELDTGDSGNLRFATSRTIGAGVVRPVLQSFECTHPKVDVSYFIMCSSQQAESEVLNERAEFALIGRVAPGWPLDVRPLFKEPLVVAISPSHPLADEPRMTIQSLGPHALLLREAPVLGREQIMKLLEQSGVTPKIVELGSTEAVKADAIEGRGIGILPQTTVADEVASGALIQCSVAGFQPKRTVFIASMSTKPLSPVAQSFLRLIRGYGSHCALAPRPA